MVIGKADFTWDRGRFTRRFVHSYDSLHHKIQMFDGTLTNFPACHLRLLEQPDVTNIPTDVETYCKEVKGGLTTEDIAALTPRPYRLYINSSFIGTIACTTCPIIGWFNYPNSVWSHIVFQCLRKNRLSMPLVILVRLTIYHGKQSANIPTLFDLKMI